MNSIMINDNYDNLKITYLILLNNNRSKSTVLARESKFGILCI